MGRPAGVALAVALLDPVRARAAVRELAGTAGSAEELAADEAFWRVVQHAFAVDRSLINLNNGGVSPSPRVVQEAMRRYLEFSNQAPAYTMWRVLEPPRDGAAGAGAPVRLRRRGDRHHPQHLREAPDGPARPRPRARRRGADHHPGLPADAHHLQAARSGATGSC